MSNENPIESLLLPDEPIEWLAAPDWSRAARPPRRWRTLIGMTLLALLASLIAILVIDASGDAEPQTLARSASGVAVLIVCALTIYLWIKVAGSVFALFERPDPRPSETYALTDRRLIVTRGDPPVTQTVTSANYLLEATLRPNGRVHDLALWFGPRGQGEYYDNGDPLLLHALEDGADAKKKIVARFGPPKWEPATSGS